MKSDRPPLRKQSYTRISCAIAPITAAFLLAAPNTKAAVELIQNGEFNNLFTSWVVGSNQTSPFTASFNDGNNLQVVNSTSGAPAWFLRNTSSNYFGTPTVPINGNTAYNAFDGSGGMFWLRQNINNSTPLVSAELSFTIAHQSTYSGSPRTFDVNLLDAANNIVANLYSLALPNNNTSWNPVAINLDIENWMNTYLGQFTQIEFRQSVPGNYTGPATFGIDRISLQVSNIPEPSTILLSVLGGVGLLIRRREH
jgi:hypothetical protein